MEIKRIFYIYIKPNIFQIFYLIFYILLFPIVKTTDSNIEFIQAATLINGNIFIIEKNNTHIYINIYDHCWNKNYSINICNSIGAHLSKNEIAKFTENNFDLLITVIKEKIYIFNNMGENVLINNNNENLYGDYYNIIPIEKNESEKTYTYAIAFALNNNLKLKFFVYNYNNQSNELKHNITNIEFENISSQLQDSIFSCQLMSHLDKNEIIVCFYQVNINSKALLGVFYVDTIDYSITFQRNISQENPIKFLKSVVNYEKNKALICFGSDQNKKCNCMIYSFENDSFSELKEYDIYCSLDYSLSKFYYVKETEEYLFYCADNEKVSLVRFDNNFNSKGKNNTFKFSGYNNIRSLSILYLNNSGYYIISNSENGPFNKNNINIYNINNDDNIKIPSTNKDHNSEASFMIPSIYSSFIKESSSNSINPENISSTLTSYNPTIPTNKHSIENIPSNNPTNIFSFNTIYTTKILPSISYLNNNSQNVVHFSFITQVVTLPSTQYINEDTIDIKKEDLINELEKIIDKIERGKIYKKVGEDYSILIYPTNSTYLTSTTHVNFSQCESILRNTLQIPESSMITFLQIELENEDSKSLINQVEYKAYIDNHTPLNLSLCNDATIQVFYAIKNNSIINFISVDSFKDLGVDVFNIHDSFFNDICEPYSESDNDLILEDRIKDIFQNYSLCEEGCTYNEIDLENKIISCDCKVKSTVTTDISSLNLEEAEGSSTNFEVIKCYNLVFSLEGKLNNIGFWILSFLVLAHFPILFYYFKKGVKPVKDYILKEMEEYGYIKENKQIKNKKFKNSENNNLKKTSKHKKKIKNKKSNVGPPPKHKNEKCENHNNHITKDLKLIDSSSSFNIIKSTKREIFPKNKDDNTKKGIKDNKIRNHNNNKILQSKKSNISKKILYKNNTQTNKKFKSKKHDNMAKLPTQTLNNNIMELSSITEKNKNHNNYSLIKMNLNLNRDQNYIPPKSNIILNNYTFEEAIKYDKRQLCEIFYIFALAKQIFFHTFLYRSPLELFSLRLILFIFIISCDLSLNALFYFNENISKKYRNAKNVFLFTYTDNIVIIFLSIIVGFILLTLLAKLSNSTSTIREVFRKEEEKLKNNKKYTITQIRKTEILLEIEQILKKHRMKVIIFIIIEFILMLFFWYFVIAFCHVYNATQISWLLDSLTSILIRAIIELLISLGLAKLYIMAIVSECHCLYKFLMFLYNFG